MGDALAERPHPSHTLVNRVKTPISHSGVPDVRDVCHWYKAYKRIGPRWHLACKGEGSSVNLFYLQESIKTYESLIAAFNQRREVLLARRKTATGSMVHHIDESIRLNDGSIRAMENALKSAQANFSMVTELTIAKQGPTNHEAGPQS